MPQISKSKASIRFLGDDLDPEEVTRLLGARPSQQFRKGDVRVQDERRREFETGVWLIDADERHPEAVAEQIASLFDRMSRDADVWRALAARFRADVFFGLFLDHLNEYLTLPPEILRAVADRGLKLTLDVYGRGGPIYVLPESDAAV